MKTILIVSSLIASTFAFDAALAKDASKSANDFRAASPYSDMQAPAQRLLPRPNSCAPDRANPIWGANGQVLGYECFGNADMS